MFGTRNLFYKTEAVSQVQNGQTSEHIQYLKRLYQQAKQISQITAYIWRWADESEQKYAEQKKVANQLKTYFEQPNKDGKNNDDYLKEMLAADPTKKELPAFPDPAYLLRQVFFSEGDKNNGYIFPIFDDYELGYQTEGLGYSFEITVSNFVGQILDADMNSPELFKMIIPYPPCPPLGDATLNKDTLDDWINNREKNQYFSTNPYIPTTCS